MRVHRYLLPPIIFLFLNTIFFFSMIIIMGLKILVHKTSITSSNLISFILIWPQP